MVVAVGDPVGVIDPTTGEVATQRIASILFRHDTTAEPESLPCMSPSFYSTLVRDYNGASISLTLDSGEELSYADFKQRLSVVDHAQNYDEGPDITR